MAYEYNKKSNAEIMADGQKYVMNTYGRLPIAMVKGNGVYVYDADGKEYLDFVAGVAVNALGHAHPEVVDAICTQANNILHCSNLYWIAPQVELMNNDERLAGYTYTQLTDVEQEKNGLYTYDRIPKCKEENFAAIFGAVPERLKK